MIPTTKSPLTTSDRKLIAQVVSRSDFASTVTPDEIITLRIQDNAVVWIRLARNTAMVHLDVVKEPSIWIPFDRNWFRQQVQEIKAVGVEKTYN